MAIFYSLSVAFAAMSVFFMHVNGLGTGTHSRRIRTFNNINKATDHDDAISEAADAVARDVVNFLEQDGFDFSNTKKVANLVSFLQVTHDLNEKELDDVLSKLKRGGASLFKKTKQFAQKHAKETLTHAAKLAVFAVLKKGVPMIEKAYEDAMQHIPLELRIEYAPMAFNLWNELYKKLKISIPEEFNIEKFICSGMSKEQCDDVIRRSKALDEDAAIEEGTEGNGDIAAEEDDLDDAFSI